MNFNDARMKVYMRLKGYIKLMSFLAKHIPF